MTPDSENKHQLNSIEVIFQTLAILFYVAPHAVLDCLNSLRDDFAESFFKSTPTFQISERPDRRSTSSWGDNYMDYWRQD